MNKQDILNQIEWHLEETEGENASGTFDQGYKEGCYHCEALIEQLDEPQAEKLEVTQEFADWFEKSMMWKHNGSWAAKEIAGYGWGAYMHDPETGEELLPKKYPWVGAVQNNKEKHIKAIYDGYTVEQPKRWVVKFEQDNEQFYFNSWMHVYSTQPIGYARKEADNVIKFTDKKKAEAVAVLVEGSVEEI